MFIAAITVVIGSKNVKFPHSNKKVEYSEDCFLLLVKLLNITVSRYTYVANSYFNNPENIVTPMRKFFHTKTSLLLSNKLMLKQIPKQFFFFFFNYVVVGAMWYSWSQP